ncbi:ATP-binding cassette domain-containing protein [Arthrobacter oryzae]|uniref:ATP-binding cassette domain-containing protein n=1 Tax=Arthrobacter oryzae TaxID=409290 RepID=UPI0026932882|nr:ATP-binding cassette domain-containing protein [Arthrobacter oryzae]
MVFQSFNLFPHMTVLGNVTFAPAHLGKGSTAETEARALEQLRKVGMDAHADKYPHQRSGGQQQRVAIAREVADRVVFMDQGVVVEEGPQAELFDNPQHERTRRFLSRGPATG